MWERLKSSSTWIIIMFLVIVVQAYIISQKTQTIQQKEDRIVKIEQNHALDLDFARNQRRTVITTIIKPDGEKVKVVEKDSDQIKVSEKVTDKKVVSDETHHETIMRLPHDWTLGVAFTSNLGGPVFKQVMVSRRIIGPIYGNVIVTTNKEFLLGISMEF